MKIGEIKKQALLLIFPEIEARFDSERNESVNEGIAALKCDPSIRGYLESSVPAINRALCEIENAGATKIKSASILHTSGNCLLDLKNEISDFYRVVGIYRGTKPLKYSMRGNTAILSEDKNGEITVFYKAEAQKISYVTEDASEIDLDFGVVSLIPYFVAAELCSTQNGERASNLFKQFYDGLKHFEEKAVTKSEVEAVYSWC